jgi:DUF4097 and DUF4098 domain-containing protein YvlB
MDLLNNEEESMRIKYEALPAVVVMLLFLSFMASLGFGASIQYDKTEDFKETLPLKKGGTFSLTNVNGNITIETWAREELEVQAEKAVRGQRENLDRIKIEIDSDPASVVITTVFPKIPRFRGRVTYEIKVPEDIDLEMVGSVNGSVRIFGPLEDVKARTSNGSIRLEGASGQISCTTTNGNVEAMDIQGEILARSTNGSLRLEIASVVDDITATTTNGSITLEIGSGNIDADLKARTTNGRIYVDFPVTLQAGYSSRRMVEGKIGDGGPLITLRTTNGSVRIQK